MLIVMNSNQTKQILECVSCREKLDKKGEKKTIPRKKIWRADMEIASLNKQKTC